MSDRVTLTLDREEVEALVHPEPDGGANAAWLAWDSAWGSALRKLRAALPSGTTDASSSSSEMERERVLEIAELVEMVTEEEDRFPGHRRSAAFLRRLADRLPPSSSTGEDESKRAAWAAQEQAEAERDKAREQVARWLRSDSTVDDVGRHQFELDGSVGGAEAWFSVSELMRDEYRDDGRKILTALAERLLEETTSCA